MTSAETQAENEAFDSLGSKQYARAAKAFRRALTFSPENAANWGNLGAVYYLFVQDNLVPYVGQNWLVNVYAFDQTNRIAPRLRRVVESVTDSRHLQGLQRCLAESERCFDRSLELSDKPSTARYWRALVYRNTGRFEDAIRELNLMAGPGASRGDAANAAKDLAALQQTTWESINGGTLPATPAALKIEQMFGTELKGLLADLGS